MTGPAQDAQDVIDAALQSCIDQGVHVTSVTGLGSIITDRELTEAERITLADYVEALRTSK